MFHVPEKYRVTMESNPTSVPNFLLTDDSFGNSGIFVVPLQGVAGKYQLYCIASDGFGWEHVSAHVVRNGVAMTPSWAEMCMIKDLF